MSPACIHAASELLYNRSPDYKTIDPCTNFDKYMCDGWSDRHDMRADQGGKFISGTFIIPLRSLIAPH
jgi:endothelin-converting enzyme